MGGQLAKALFRRDRFVVGHNGRVNGDTIERILDEVHNWHGQLLCGDAPDARINGDKNVHLPRGQVHLWMYGLGNNLVNAPSLTIRNQYGASVVVTL